MRQYYGDPDEAYWRYDADQAQDDTRAPRCLLCGERIQDEQCYVLTKSYLKEEQRLASVHCACLKMRRNPMKYTKFMNAVIDLIEEEYCQKTPRWEEWEVES